VKLRRRYAVSELYAAMLMIGVTLSFGGLVTAAAVDQFSATTGGESLAASAQQASVGKQISLVYGTVTAGSGGCTSTYRGPDGNTYAEGKTYTLVLYDFGSASFTPGEVFDNGTLLAVEGYATIASSQPGQSPSPVSNTLTLTACAHPAGQTFLLVDASGDEITVGT
jgi:hypothetical protein